MFVLPLYEVLLVPGVNMYVRGEEFEEFALSKAVLHEDVVLLTAKEQKPRYAYTADDFYEIGVGGYVSDVSQDGFVTIRANERLRIDAVRVNDDATIEVETTGLIDVRDVPEEEPVTDEEYGNLEIADYTPQVNEDNAFMFQKADEAMESDTFSGPAYVSNIIGEDNVAGAPGLHYVVFDPGVINNWHTHEGGQILIATDGIGYHQIEGQPVEVLYPGDVALCPPGEKHWHGGSADTSFAHIAVNTNPELTGLEWFDRISDEEYAALPTEKPAEDAQ